MQISGEKILAVIEAQDYYQEALTVADGQAIELDQLFQKVDEHLMDAQLMSISLAVNGGVSEGGTTLTLESNVINLPLRYQNQLKKLVYVEEDYDVNLYMYIENMDVSQSHLKIAKVSSITAYSDDLEGGQAKISQWFDEQLAHIVEVQKQVAAEEVAEKEAENKKA
ncbi:hypothetical protein [Convivina intestini]|uniref:Uncharacterized protein n=1 Tax=Convivina intestini TaxID=1505726 RepID=A0A2U1DCA7_9LACO|nr:hypothetical protein [Convivina intestini]PVY85324.1 hypothetical protein C7384_102144 [Convivina intestini]CAH1852865.1 hypothetical protein R077811_00542 [Convivina intestini]SDB86330.1 hypothetical protein SAMN05216341_102115 [Leuconostocaceae bacterium R-53105]